MSLTFFLFARYFESSKFSSFQRQLNLYGFSRLSLGEDRGGYYHEYFLRGRPDLLTNLKRLRVKGSGVRKIPLLETEPNFYEMPYSYDTKIPSPWPSAPLPLSDGSSQRAISASTNQSSESDSQQITWDTSSTSAMLSQSNLMNSPTRVVALSTPIQALESFTMTEFDVDPLSVSDTKEAPKTMNVKLPAHDTMCTEQLLLPEPRPFAFDGLVQQAGAKAFNGLFVVHGSHTTTAPQSQL